MRPVSIVWHKRDLRVADHAPLAEAASAGTVIPVYIYEPTILGAEEYEESWVEFLNECLAELEEEYAKHGGRLIRRLGDAVEILEDLRRETGAGRLYSHEETGNAATYARDRRVKGWARSQGVEWIEIPQNGVVRGLKSRDGWSRTWKKRMSQTPVDTPIRLEVPSLTEFGRPRTAEEMGVQPGRKPYRQKGGRSEGLAALESFLRERGRNYTRAMSSPLAGESECSRLSPYLAFGCVSMREAWHALEARRAELRDAEDGVRRGWPGSLKSFEGRLHWHCHFMQKLESEPRIEFENIARACDGLREEEFSEERFARWCEGETGYPMVDACMRYVRQTGWLNFRMRAMLVSFAAYDLWLHWRRPAVFLARHFLDFEPGIHFSQFQMQSGTTGINTLRMYNPVKQARDHDPQGEFVRRWVPELAGVPVGHLFEPWKMPSDLQAASGCRIGKDYPLPVVNHAEAVRRAKERLYGRRGEVAAREEAREIARRHGSRKGPRRPRRREQKDAAPDMLNTMPGMETS